MFILLARSRAVSGEGARAPRNRPRSAAVEHFEGECVSQSPRMEIVSAIGITAALVPMAGGGLPQLPVVASPRRRTALHARVRRYTLRLWWRQPAGRVG